MKVLNIAFVILFSFVFSITAFANTATAGYSRLDMFSKIKEAIKNPTKAKKFVNPYGLVGQLAFEGLMQGIDKLSEQAQNPTWIDEKTKQNTNQSTQNTQTKAQGDWDYIFDDTVFRSVEQAKSYMIGEYMAKNDYKFSRRDDGYYYQYFVVNYEQRSFTLYAQIAQKDDKACVKYNDRCGWSTFFTGTMIPIGTINNTTTINTKDVAKDIAVNQVINDYLDKYEAELEKEGVKVGATTPTNTAENTETVSNVKPRPTDTAEEASDTHTDATVSDKNKENDKVIDNAQTKDKTKETAKEKDKEQEEKKDKEKEKEFPDFCDWAKHICDFIEWFKEEPPEPEAQREVPKAGLNDISELQRVDRFARRVNFDGQCPTGTLSFEVKSVSYSYQIPYNHFCSLLEQLRPWLLAFTYLSTAFFVVRSL